MSSSPLPAYNALVASAMPILPDKKLAPKYERWQDEVWDYYDRVGEFEYGVSWTANTVSRIRLVAAELSPDGGEPILIEQGPAADAIARMAGGVGGQAQLMKEFTIHYSVPGECWLVGEEPDAETGVSEEQWCIKSADEIRIAKKKIRSLPTYEVKENDTTWRAISPESLVVRCWNPHPRFGWKADSPGKHAIPALFEIDVTNKRIIATILSRLASNGILLYDKGKLSFPPRENPTGAQEVDPFAQILVEVAGRGIKDPASPEACIPIPIGFEIDDMTNVDPKLLLQLVRTDNDVDQKLLGLRESALKRLATSMDLPAEILLGMGDASHWTGWQIEESALKVHVTPMAELICHSLTIGYLIPMLKAGGEDLVGPNGGKIVVWYDPSEITVRPDKSGNVIQAYDRVEVSGEALRREIGVDEDDAPNDDERLRILLVKQAIAGNMEAMKALGFEPQTDGGEKVDPAIQMTFDLIKAAPTLAQDPGMLELADSVRDLLAGKTSSDAAPVAPEAPPAGEEPPPAPEPPADEEAPENGGERTGTPPTQGTPPEAGPEGTP